MTNGPEGMRKDGPPSKEATVFPPIEFSDNNIRAINLWKEFRKIPYDDKAGRLQKLNEALIANPNSLSLLYARLPYLREVGEFRQAAEDVLRILSATTARTWVSVCQSELSRAIDESSRDQITYEMQDDFKRRLKEIFEQSKFKTQGSWDSFLEHHSQGEYDEAYGALLGGNLTAEQSQYARKYFAAYEAATGRSWGT